MEQPITAADIAADDVEQHDGVWHQANCSILRDETGDGTGAYTPGDIPCDCDREAAARIADLLGLNPPAWTDTLARLARYAADNELPAPYFINLDGDSDGGIEVSVYFEHSAAWMERFPNGPTTIARLTGSRVQTSSWGELDNGAMVTVVTIDLGLGS